MPHRYLTPLVLTALADTPVVFLRGARQTGKTTLVKSLCQDGERAYVTLDSLTALAAATADPAGFLHALPKPVAIDVVQRVPALLLAIKEDVDNDRVPGRYLLTGSSDVLTLPKVADSLAGRMEVLTLYPLSQGEIAGVPDDFIARIFTPGDADFASGNAQSALSAPPWSRDKLLSALVAGGYPEVLSRPAPDRRAAWFESYLTTLIERDVRDVANIHDRSALVRLVGLLAARSGGLHNAADIARSAGLNAVTLARYFSVLEALFLVWSLPAWSANLGKRLMKSPKLHMTDSGLACHLCGMDEGRLAADPVAAGRLLESFVASELRRQAGWSGHAARFYHYRTQGGEEVDILLEDRAGRVAAVEVKLAGSVTPRDARSLVALRDALGDSFVRGVALYSGTEIVPLGERLFAVPIGMCFSPWSVWT